MSSHFSELTIRVIPNASRNEIVGMLGDDLKVKVQAPPEGGRANKCVIEVLSKELGVARKAVSIISGDKARNKRVRLEGYSEAELKAFLEKQA